MSLPEEAPTAEALPADVAEQVAAAVHEQWMRTKRQQGFTSRTSETGEEMMVPYEKLSEQAKDVDRGTVRAVVSGLQAAGWVIAEQPPALLEEPEPPTNVQFVCRDGSTIPAECVYAGVDPDDGLHAWNLVRPADPNVARIMIDRLPARTKISGMVERDGDA